MGSDPGLVEVEQRLEALTQRVIRLEEQREPAAVPVPQRAPFAPPSEYWAPPPSASGVPAFTPRNKRQPWVELTPSRVLAVAGGLVLLLGIGFLVRYAFAQGWLGPEARIVLALVASAAVAAVGVRLERSADTRAVGQVCTATGAAGAYTAVVSATVGYVLIPDLAGLLVACGVAAAVVARGVWARSQWATGLGLGGAMAAPAIVNAVGSAGTLALLVVLLAAGLHVTVRCNWPRLSVLSFAVVSPQLWAIAGEGPDLVRGLVLVGVCGVLFLAAGVAHGAAGGSGVVTPLLTGANAVSVAAMGWALLHDASGATSDAAAAWWVAGVGAAHLLVAIPAALRLPRSPAGVVPMASGLLLTDVAVLMLVDGHRVAAAFVALAVVVAAISLAAAQLRDVAGVGVVVQLVVMGLYGLTVQIGLPSPGTAEAVAMVVCLSAGGVLLAALTHHLGRGVAVASAGVLLGLAAVRLLAVEAPVQALLEGPDDLRVTLAMCVALTGAAGALGWRLQSVFTNAGVLVANYAVSLAAVSMDPDGAGRVALTGLWAVGGAAALIAGRTWNRRDLRRGGGALLAAAVTKAAFVDTVLLDGTHRAVALLLCGGVVVATAVAEARWAATEPSGTPAAQ